MQWSGLAYLNEILDCGPRLFDSYFDEIWNFNFTWFHRFQNCICFCSTTLPSIVRGFGQ